MNLLVIGDPHAHPDYDNSRFTALGRFIAKEKPQVIVCIGDMADMPSLSSYDKGTKGFEGRRYKKDVKAVIDAQEKLFAPIKRIRGYKPKLHMCLGNHEDRITRAINNTPELDGAIGIEDLQYERFQSLLYIRCSREANQFCPHRLCFDYKVTLLCGAGPLSPV
jgi:predicted MPP superfamily phosphohydrolase